MRRSHVYRSFSDDSRSSPSDRARRRAGRRNAICAAAIVATAALAPAHRAPAVLVNLTFDAASGNWGIAGNWNPATIPNNGGGNTYNATIPAGSAILDLNNVTIEDLNITGSGQLTSISSRTMFVNDVLTVAGGTISGSISINASDQIEWTSGRIGGSGQVSASGGVSMTGSAGRRLSDNRIVVAAGNSFWTGGAIIADSGTVWTNNGQFTADGGNLTWNGGNFNNDANFFKSTSASAVTLGCVFNNSNTVVNFSTGLLAFTGGGTHTGSFATFGTSAGEFAFSGPHNFQAASQVTANDASFVGGLINVAGGYSARAVTTIDGGAVSFNGTAAATTGTLDLAGNLLGANTVIANTSTLWKGGVIGGSGLLEARTSLNIGGTNFKSLNDTRVIRNFGAGTWAADSANVAGATTAVLDNLPGATFTVLGNAAFSAKFANAGVLTKSTGTGTTEFAGPFVNTGTVSGNAGVLVFSGGGSHTGRFAGAATTTFRGLHAFLPGSVVTGNNVVFGNAGGSTAATIGGTFNPTGVVVTNNATVTFNAAANPANFNLASGTLSGTGNVTVGTFVWAGGAMTDAGTTTIGGFLNLTAASGVMNFNNRTIQNNGVVNWTSAQALTGGAGAAFNNAGPFNIDTDADFNTATFNNTAVVSKNSGTGVTIFAAPFNNNGTVTVAVGTLRLSGGGSHTGNWTNLGAGTLDFGGGVHTATGPIGTDNVVFSAGTTNVNGAYAPVTTTVSGNATVNFNGPGNAGVGAFTFSGGTISGTANVLSSAPASWTGGTFSGTGIVNLNGTLTIGAGSAKGVAGSRSLFVGGATTWSGGNLANGPDGFVQFNALDLEDNSSFVGGTLSATTFTKSGGGGVSQVAGRYFAASGGTVTVNSGTLSFAGGGTHRGVYQGSPGTTLQFGGGAHAFTNGLIITHPNVVVSSGTVTVDTSPGVTIPNLALIAGRLDGNRNVTVPGTFVWNPAATMAGPGHTISTGTATLGGGALLQGRTLDVANRGDWGAGNFANDADTSLNVSNTATLLITSTGIYAGGTVNNGGAIAKTAGPGNTIFNAALNNAGSFDVSIGTVFLNGGGFHTGAFTGGSFQFSGDHTFDATSALTPSNVNFNAGRHVVRGNWRVSGQTVFAGSSTTTFFIDATPTGVHGQFVVLGGAVVFDNGEEVVVNNFQLSGGTVGGSATLTVNNSTFWGDGSFVGGGTVNLNGTTTLNSNQPIGIGGKTISIGGQATWNGTGNMSGAAGAVLHVRAGASVDLLNNNSIHVPVANQGTITKAAGGTTELHGFFTNAGTAVVNAGVLRFAGGGSSSGRFTSGSGSSVQIVGGTASFTGQYSAHAVTVSGGELGLGGAQSYDIGAQLNLVNSGSATLSSDAGALDRRLTVVVQDDARLEVAATQHLLSLALSGSARARVGASPTPGQRVLVTTGLGLVGDTTLDLTNNALVYDHGGVSPLAGFRNQIVSAFAGGSWNGSGITSATAGVSPSSHGVGYGEASTIFGIAGAQTASFLGETVDATATLARFTRLGDATLDGVVDFNDLVKLAQNYNTIVSNSTGDWWANGDFTYDGVADFNDLVKLAQNYNAALPAAGILGASVEFEVDLARAFASVPEPGALAFIGLTATAFASRRRRRGSWGT